MQRHRILLDGAQVDETSALIDLGRPHKLDGLYDALKRRGPSNTAVTVDVAEDAPAVVFVSALHTIDFALAGDPQLLLNTDGQKRIRVDGGDYALDLVRRYLRVLHLYLAADSLVLAWQLGGPQDSRCLRRVTRLPVPPASGRWQRFEALGRTLTEELRSHGQAGATVHPVVLHVGPTERYGRVSGVARAAERAGALLRMDTSSSSEQPPSKLSAPDCVPHVALFDGPEMQFGYDPHWAAFGACVDECETRNRAKNENDKCAVICRSKCKPVCDTVDHFCPTLCKDLPTTLPKLPLRSR